jgi:hypothetical protein
MYLTVTCSEGVPFISEMDMVAETRRRRARARAHRRVPGLAKGAIPRTFIDPVRSDAPVLILVEGWLRAESGRSGRGTGHWTRS